MGRTYLLLLISVSVAVTAAEDRRTWLSLNHNPNVNEAGTSRNAGHYSAEDRRVGLNLNRNPNVNEAGTSRNAANAGLFSAQPSHIVYVQNGRLHATISSMPNHQLPSQLLEHPPYPGWIQWKPNSDQPPPPGSIHVYSVYDALPQTAASITVSTFSYNFGKGESEVIPGQDKVNPICWLRPDKRCDQKNVLSFLPGRPVFASAECVPNVDRIIWLPDHYCMVHGMTFLGEQPQKLNCVLYSPHHERRKIYIRCG